VLADVRIISGRSHDSPLRDLACSISVRSTMTVSSI
jgi:hypothetical protein